MSSSKRSRWLWLLSILATVLGVMWLMERRWNQWFSVVKSGKAKVLGRDGRAYIGQRITIQSLLECPSDRAWEYACTSGFMHHVSWPLLRLGQHGDVLPIEWSEGDIFQVQLSTLGFVPLGEHTIMIDKVDREQGVIHSVEHGRLIPAS